MPIFEFRCKGCDHRFDFLVRSKNDERVTCPSCRSEEVTRLMSTFAARSGGGTAPSSNGTAGSGRGCGSSCGCHP